VGPCGVSATANALGVPVVVTLSNSLCSTAPQTGVITVLAASASIGPCSVSASANALGVPVVVTVPNLCSTSQFGASIGSCGISASAGLLGLPIVVSLGNGLCSYSYSQTLPTLTASLGGTLTGSLGLSLGGSITPLSLSAPSVPVVTVPLGLTVDSCSVGASVGLLGVPIVIDLGGVCSTFYTSQSQSSTVTVTQITVISMTTTTGSGSQPASNSATTTPATNSKQHIESKRALTHGAQLARL
jgi:hypothetical protein